MKGTNIKPLPKDVQTRLDSFEFTSTKIKYLLFLKYKPKYIKQVLDLTCVQHVHNEKDRNCKNPREPHNFK